jgi:hypothetical protein
MKCPGYSFHQPRNVPILTEKYPNCRCCKLSLIDAPEDLLLPRVVLPITKKIFFGIDIDKNETFNKTTKPIVCTQVVH